MYSKLLIVILLLGCSAPIVKDSKTIISKSSFEQEPSFVTEDGIKVWANDVPITRDAMTTATHVFVYGLFLKGVDESVSLPALKKVKVEWVSAYIEVAEDEGLTYASGIRHKNEVIVFWPGNIAESSLYHEWMHVILYTLVQTTDPEHTSAWWTTVLEELTDLAKESEI